MIGESNKVKAVNIKSWIQNKIISIILISLLLKALSFGDIKEKKIKINSLIQSKIKSIILISLLLKALSLGHIKAKTIAINIRNENPIY